MRRPFIACILPWPAIVAAAPVSNPWFGTWKLRLPDPAEEPETLVYSEAGGGAMRMESVEANSLIVTRFDGRPAADTGASAVSGPRRSLAVMAVSPIRYRWTFAVDGKPFVAGVNTLAGDRRSFTEISWRVNTPTKKVTLIYERQ